MNTKVLAITIVAVLIIGSVGAFLLTNTDDDDNGLPTTGSEVIDAMGRTVIIPDNFDNGIIVVGSYGPLRFLSVFDVYDLIVEVDQGDTNYQEYGKAYSYAYNWSEMSYHADVESYLEAGVAEQIGNKNPSLIITTSDIWGASASTFGPLADHFTTVVINEQQSWYMFESDFTIAGWMEENYRILGTVLGQEERAEELIDGINDTLKDIRSLIGESETTTYIAGVTWNGTNGLETTFPYYLPLVLVDGINAYNGTSTDRKVTFASAEDVAILNINRIVIDPSSSDKLNEKNSQDVLKWIYGINNDDDPDNDIELYITIPVVWDSANYDCVLVSAYYMAYLLYDTLTLEEVWEKAQAVFELYYGNNGTNVVYDMDSFFSENAGLSLFTEVKVATDDGTYYYLVYV